MHPKIATRPKAHCWLSLLICLSLLFFSVAVPNAICAPPAFSSGPISADGRVAAFASAASDLVANDRNGNVDVFLRDLATGVTTLVSQNLAGTGSANGRSDGVVLGADGTVAAFVSTASDLTSQSLNVEN